VLEGVAFGLRDGLDLMTGMGVQADRARVSGGGARSQTWLEIIASVLELPLERMAVDEGAAYGAALLGAVAGGVFESVPEAVEACVRVTATSIPIRRSCRTYAGLLPHYRALYPALRAVRP
jgi:xylulokinase